MQVYANVQLHELYKSDEITTQNDASCTYCVCGGAFFLHWNLRDLSSVAYTWHRPHHSGSPVNSPLFPLV